MLQLKDSINRKLKTDCNNGVNNLIELLVKCVEMTRVVN